MRIATMGWLAAAVASAVSLALRRPWTAIPARRRLPEPMWAHPVFRETNMVLTAGWTVLFGAAALVSAGTPWWTSPIMGGVSAVLAELSHKVGGRYAAWRLARAAR